MAWTPGVTWWLWEALKALRYALITYQRASMTNTWLKQIFKNEGDILGAYVLSKQRRNNETKFGFVRFRKECETASAISRNNGLWIKGQQISVTLTKYSNGKAIQYNNSSGSSRSGKLVRNEQRKECRLVLRDARSYKEVTKLNHIINVSLIKNWKNG